MTRRIIQVYRGTTGQNDLFTGASGELSMDTTRKELRVHDGSTAGGILVGLKPGFMCAFAGSTAPDGWLICDGSAISRTTYARLFAAIGTTFGAGDESSTFNLPNLSERMPVYKNGASLGTTTNGGVPNVWGEASAAGEDSSYMGAHGTSGAFYCAQQGKVGSGTSGAATYTITLGINATQCSGVYDSGTTVRPAGVYTLWCIKY